MQTVCVSCCSVNFLLSGKLITWLCVAFFRARLHVHESPLNASIVSGIFQKLLPFTFKFPTLKTSDISCFCFFSRVPFVWKAVAWIFKVASSFFVDKEGWSFWCLNFQTFMNNCNNTLRKFPLITKHHDHYGFSSHLTFSVYFLIFLVWLSSSDIFFETSSCFISCHHQEHKRFTFYTFRKHLKYQQRV